MFDAGSGPYNNHLDDLSQACPWELNPARWNHPAELAPRHYPSVREQCSCVGHNDTGAHSFNAGIPHPLPHLQVKGQGYRRRRTVRYVTVEQEEDCACNSEHYHFENLQPGHLPNGHCGPRHPPFEGGEERDRHQDWSGPKGGSEEGCNGHGSSASNTGFFSTEVPQKHLNPSRRKGPCVPSSGSPEPLGPKRELQRQDLEVVEQNRRQDSVREQIRQVVTDLEDVLGGLKKVHVEMKEVVDEIDRLTANMDLSEDTPCLTHWTSSAFPSLSDLDLRATPSTDHGPEPVQAAQHVDDDRIILRTNSPSPVHMASVVKTSRIVASGHGKDITHERPGLNGHPPHLYRTKEPDRAGRTPSEPAPRTGLDPKVIIGNSTGKSKTQKPPPYPQNGRCGKGPHPPPKPGRTPAYPGRGRQSSSAV